MKIIINNSSMVPIYWKWPYEGNDGANDSDDTSSGKTAGEMTFTITVTGTQQEPSKAVNS